MFSPRVGSDRILYLLTGLGTSFDGLQQLSSPVACDHDVRKGDEHNVGVMIHTENES